MIVTVPGARLTLRPVTAADAPVVVAWRNAARKCFFTPRLITEADHLRFLERKSPLDYVWMAETADGQPMGMVSVTTWSGEWGRYLLAPGNGGHGYGLELGWLGLHAGYDVLGARHLWADCVGGNAIGINAHLSMGWRKVGVNVPGHIRPGFDVVHLQYERERWEAEKAMRWEMVADYFEVPRANAG